jgi:hypothetical protein
MIDLPLITMHAAAVGVLACLVSESRIAAPIRDRIGWSVLYCPICLGFWLALPVVLKGILFYFTTVAISNVWMLVILKVYRELDDSSED